MKKIILALSLVALLSPLAYADDQTVASAPTDTYDKLKGIVDRLDPQAEALWNWENNQFEQGYSVAVYKLASNDIHMLDLRAGYSMDKMAYGSTVIDLAGLSKKFLPAKFNEAWESVPSPIKGLGAKYTRVGGFVGYSWDNDAPAYGATFGVKVELP